MPDISKPHRRLFPLLSGSAVFCLCLAPMARPAHAQQATETQPAAKEPVSFWQQDTMTGDWGGLRSRLVEKGITLEVTETLELWGNVAGGLRRGATVMGVGKAGLTFDLEKLVQWPGAKIVVNAYQIHGRGLSANYVGNLLTVSNIEAERSTRLNDFYIEQSLFDEGLNVRVGQFAADEEFMTSDVAATFINSTFGWPGIFGLDLPGGGPAYPFATPGVRVRYAPAPEFSIQGAVFNGNPLGRRGDPGGTEFPMTGTFAIIEAAISTAPAAGGPGLGGNFKFGAWSNSLRFDDLHYDTLGLSLADPAGSGIPRSHRGNYGLYAVADHALYRTPGTEAGGLSGFLRFATVPRQDRSPVYVYLDAGLTWKGTFPGRDDDVVGLAFAWANLSNTLGGLDRDRIFFSGITQPIQSAEMALELTYQAPITPWLSIQPDFQYIIRPGGNAPDPRNPATPLKNAVVLGLRTAITF